MRESQIERHLKVEVEKLDGLCLKFVSPGLRGVPDRIVLLPKGRIIFAELKNEKGRLSALQNRMLSILKGLGFQTVVLKSIEEVNSFIAELRDER